MADIISFPKRKAASPAVTDTQMVSIGRRICAEIDLMVDVACPSDDEADRSAAWQAIAAGVILSLIGDQAAAGGGSALAQFGLSADDIERLSVIT